MRAWWTFTAAVLVFASVGTASAKGRARSFVLEGTIVIPARDRPEHFVLTGDLRVMDCRKACETTTWQRATRMSVKVEITPGQFFVARDPIYNAAAVRDPRSMIGLLRDAAEHRHRTRLELVDPEIRFGSMGDVVEVETQVERMLDFHLESATAEPGRSPTAGPAACPSKNP